MYQAVLEYCLIEIGVIVAPTAKSFTSKNHPKDLLRDSPSNIAPRKHLQAAGYRIFFKLQNSKKNTVLVLFYENRICKIDCLLIN